MLLNLSNHPSANWPPEQLIAVQQAYGTIQDMPFPAVPAKADLDEVRLLAEKHCAMVRQIAAEEASLTVHLMGEMTFTFIMANALCAMGIPCMASCSERIVLEESDGRKVSQFRFVRFRPYY